MSLFNLKIAFIFLILPNFNPEYVFNLRIAFTFLILLNFSLSSLEMFL